MAASEWIAANLTRALWGMAGFLPRIDWEEIAPPKKSLTRQISDLLSGNVDFFAIFDAKYLINWIEIFVILAILLFVGLVAHSLNLFGRRA